jgi:hypothetical protein
MPRADTSAHGGYHIDQRGRVVERRVHFADSTRKNCVKCMYYTPIGKELVCRRMEIPTDVNHCYGNSRYFIEVETVESTDLTPTTGE